MVFLDSGMEKLGYLLIVSGCLTGKSWFIKRVQGMLGSSLILVFSSNYVFQSWARFRDSGLEVLATIMQPET